MMITPLIIFSALGGFDGSSSQWYILTYNTDLQAWNHNFNMTKIRSGHGASVVSVEKISGYCNQP